MELCWKFILVLVSTAPPTLSFPSGAPQTACQTLTPDSTRHGAQPQITDIPYALNFSAFYDQATEEMVYTPDIVYNGMCLRRVDTGYSNDRAIVIIVYKYSRQLQAYRLPQTPAGILR